MSTIDDANVAVRRTVQRVLGLPDNYVRPANQDANAGLQGAPFATVLIMTADDAGTAGRSIESDGVGGINEILQVPVRITASIQFFKSAAKPACLRGAAASAVLTDYTGVTNGGFDLPIDGVNLQVTALNLSGAADLNAVAVLVQAKLAALAAGTTCAWTGKRFLVSSPTTGQTSAVGVAIAPTGGGSPTNVSALLALTAATGAVPRDNATGIARYGTDAFDLARRLGLLMQSTQHGAYMQFLGLGFLKAGQARDISGLSDSTWESRGSIDIDFNFIAREAIPLAQLQPPYTSIIKALSPGPSIAPNGLIREIDLSATPH